MSVTKLLRPRGGPGYYTDGFRQTIEDHLTYLKKQVSEVIAVTAQQQEKYQSDLYGLFIEKGVPQEYLWTTMRCNGFHSPADYLGEEQSFILIKPEAIKEIHGLYQSAQGRV